MSVSVLPQARSTDMRAVLSRMLMNSPSSPGTISTCCFVATECPETKRTFHSSGLRGFPPFVWDTLYACGHINDARWAAAGRFRMHWGQSGAEGAIAIDCGRVQVDGGKGIDPLPDCVVDATQQLNECSSRSGSRSVGTG
jgi:hypothetical protein